MIFYNILTRIKVLSIYYMYIKFIALYSHLHQIQHLDCCMPTGTTFKYVEGGWDREAQEVVWKCRKYQFVYLKLFKCSYRSSVLLAAQSQATGAPVEAFKALTSTPRVELSLPSTRCSPGIFGDSFVVPAMMPMVMDDDGWWRWSLMWV